MGQKRARSPSSSTLTGEGLCVEAKKVRVEAKVRNKIASFIHSSIFPLPSLIHTLNLFASNLLTKTFSQESSTSPSTLSSGSSPLPSERLSLTKDNLRKFNQITMPATATPDKKRTRSTKDSGTTTDGGSVRGVRNLLSRNNILIKDLKAEERGQFLIQKARDIVKGARQSAMRSERAQELRYLANKHATDNELTFLVEVWRRLLNDTRQARPELLAENIGEAIKWLETAWTHDNLKCNWGADFATKSIPPVTVPDDDPELKELANDIPTVSNPRPDLAYGLEKDAFTQREQMLNEEHGTRLSPNMDHPFFVVEAKSCSGPIEEAENQCARAGSAMVSLTRRFNDLAEKAGSDDHEGQTSDQDTGSSNHPTPPASSNNPNPSATTNSSPPSFPDDTSFSFSLALVPTKAHLFVNWAEVTPNAKEPTQPPHTVWQMNTIDSYDLEKPDAWPELRRDLDNVLDWGTLTRKRQLQATCARMVTEGGSQAKRQKRA